MQIELIGCTGTGKSTLANRILQACQEQNLNVVDGDDFVLQLARIGWIQSYYVRTLFVDLFTLFACLFTWRKNRTIYLLTLKIVFRLPSSFSMFKKLNMIRNTLKKIGVHEIVANYASDQQVVLLDEGTLQIAHYLFVHISGGPKQADFETFIREIPRPDVIIYLMQDEATLVERTLIKGHKRIPTGSRMHTKRFIKSTVATFDKLVCDQALMKRLIKVDGEHQIVTPPLGYQNDPLIMMALRVLYTGFPDIHLDKVDSFVSDIDLSQTLKQSI